MPEYHSCISDAMKEDSFFKILIHFMTTKMWIFKGLGQIYSKNLLIGHLLIRDNIDKKINLSFFFTLIDHGWCSYFCIRNIPARNFNKPFLIFTEIFLSILIHFICFFIQMKTLRFREDNLGHSKVTHFLSPAAWSWISILSFILDKIWHFQCLLCERNTMEIRR